MTPRTGGAGSRLRAPLLALNFAAVLAILVVDWITPAGVVVGILLALPIMAASLSDEPREVWIVFTVAAVGKVVASIFGADPVSPAGVWIPNRILAFLSLPATLAIALRLQRSRMEAERTRDLNALLVSLLAHDLRTPLVLAQQGLEYVEATTGRGQPLELDMLAELRSRLRRSLRTIQALLDMARDDLGAAVGEPPPLPQDAAEAIRDEVGSFEAEAAARSKTLILDLSGLNGASPRVDARILRQSLSILVDNALRHALPGPVTVSAASEAGFLVVRVEDSGPGLTAGSASSGQPGAGSGLGLELCRALVRRAGGALRVERDTPAGTRLALQLPLTRPARGIGAPG